jgi:hypothetical protein
MSERLKIARILPTRQNAEAMVAMTRQDLLSADVPPAVVESIADEDDPKHIIEQQTKLIRRPERYLGAIAGRQFPFGLGAPLQGFAKFNEWNAADQAQYESGDVAERLRVQVERGEKALPGNPLGIFALLVASDVVRDGHRLQVADQLLDAVVARAEGREIRTGLHESDPLLPVFEEHGFQPTEAVGVPIPGIPDYHIRLHTMQ